MKTLLRIDASAQSHKSESKQLADYFQELWMNRHPEGRVVLKDLSNLELPHIQEGTINGFFTPEEYLTPDLKKELSLSNSLIEEIASADEIVISTPLYNLNLPSSLKAYLDHVVRKGKTFEIDDSGKYLGLLKDIKASLIITKGGLFEGTHMESFDFQTPYLKAILNLIGIRVTNVFAYEGTSMPDYKKQNKEVVIGSIKNVFKAS